MLGTLGQPQQTTTTSVFYTRDPSGTLLSQRTGNSTYYYVYDGTGSIVALTDSNGKAVNTYSYDPYGNSITKTEQVTNPYQWQAGYLDATGLYHFGARYYDPALGRWTQLDESGKSQGYDYSDDDPVNKSDRTGKFSLRFAFFYSLGFAGYADYFTVYELNKHVGRCYLDLSGLEEPLLGIDIYADFKLHNDPLDENAVEPLPTHSRTLFHHYIPGLGRRGMNLC